MTRGAVLLKEKGGAELSAVPWRAARGPQAGILVGSVRGAAPPAPGQDAAERGASTFASSPCRGSPIQGAETCLKRF